MIVIPVSELLVDDRVLTKTGMFMYSIKHLDATEENFSAEVEFQSGLTGTKFWESPESQITVDRSE